MPAKDIMVTVEPGKVTVSGYVGNMRNTTVMVNNGDMDVDGLHKVNVEFVEHRSGKAILPQAGRVESVYRHGLPEERPRVEVTIKVP